MIRTTARANASWLAGLALCAGGAWALSAEDDGTVVLRPGQDFQAIVAGSPEGTRFELEPGIYRRHTIHPKSRQKFVGRGEVILSGAMELSDWSREGEFWRSQRLPPPLPFHGECLEGRELCTAREDLFFNDRVYQRVGSLEDLGPGRWYYANRSAHLADDPTGHAVELSVTPLAFGSDAKDVLLKSLIVERYASDAQEGAIYADHGRGWRIYEVIARWNHGAGLSFGPETQVKGGSFSHNGQIGIAGSGGEGSRIQRVEIAFNNYAGYNPRWEAGGTKFWETTGLIVKNSCIHHNDGPGLWTDNDNIGTIYQGNKVFLNGYEGIKHEISYDAIISDNIVLKNTTKGVDNWLWGSQILIQNSSNVKVYNNLVETANQFGNGIGVIYQERGTGAYGPWKSLNNLIYDNTIVHRIGRGQSGIVTDTGDSGFLRDGGNSFDRNTYIVADGTFEHWRFNDSNETWEGIEALGHEQAGELIVEQAIPTTLSCTR